MKKIFKSLRNFHETGLLVSRHDFVVPLYGVCESRLGKIGAADERDPLRPRLKYVRLEMESPGV